MSWLFSQALVEAYLAANSLDGAPSALLNVMHTPHPFWYRDKTMEAWSHSQFGLTYAPLTESRGEELLMWYLAGFRAKISALQERAPELMAKGPACGEKWPESLAKYDPVSCSWKTRQLLLFGGLDELSGTWPAWGLMRNGEFWEASTLEPERLESAFGFVPAPMAQDGTHAGGIDRSKGGKDWNLRDWYHKLMRGTIGTPARRRKRKFWEWLMGWPENWTALSAAETAKFQQWLDSHGKPSNPNP